MNQTIEERRKELLELGLSEDFISGIPGFEQPAAGQAAAPPRSGFQRGLQVIGGAIPGSAQLGLADFLRGGAQGAEILGRRLGASAQAFGDFLTGGGATFDPNAFLAGLPSRLQEPRSVSGEVGKSIASLGLAQKPLTPEEAASPINTAFFAFPPAGQVAVPLERAIGLGAGAAGARLARAPQVAPPPLPAVTRDISTVPGTSFRRPVELATQRPTIPQGTPFGVVDPLSLPRPPSRAIPLGEPFTPTARSIDELIEAGGRIPQEVSFRISLRQTEGANNLDYSLDIIRVRNAVDNEIRQFGDGPVPERLFSSIDDGLNIDVPPTLREASSVLTQASEETAGLGQRLLKEADELLDQAKADQIQRGIDKIGLTDKPPIPAAGVQGLPPQLPSAPVKPARRRELFGPTVDNAAFQARREAQITQQRLATAPPSPAVVPKRPSVPIGRDMPAPRETHSALLDDLELPVFEQPAQGVMRKWEGARNVAVLETESFFKEGQKTLKRSGFRTDELTDNDMRPLYQALHGEAPVEGLSPKLRAVYNDVKALQQIEEGEMLAFLNQAATDESAFRFISFDVRNLASRILAHPDYFPRLWKPPPSLRTEAGIAPGRFGGTPSLARPRVQATFTEMLESGWQPATWDPYAMMARRRLAGVQYRESTIMANRLYERGMVLPVSEAPAGWRVPKIGPIFEGRPLPDPKVRGGVTYTRRLAVPDGLAGELESFFRSSAESSVPKSLRVASNELKRFKLLGSLFQHIDFGGRALGVAFTPTGIRAGAPFKYPSLAARLLTSTWNEGFRGTLKQRILSNERMFSDFALTPRMIIEEGWGVTGDISFIQREAGEFLSQPAFRGLRGLASENVGKVQDFFQSALFDGVYREVQLWSLENFIVPWIRRTRPNATPREVAAEAAETVNIMFSSLGNWQTVFRNNPDFRDWSRTLIFSTNESEALIRGALRTLPPTPTLKNGRVAIRPQSASAGLFREWYLGLFIGLGALANVINMAATARPGAIKEGDVLGAIGQPLPLEAYKPITINDPYSPFKVGYNNRFLAPQAPLIKGRDGGPVYIDLVGQMDTALRWLTDPAAALGARTNVLPRAIINQAKGENFFGEEFANAQQRLVQAAIDVAAPIGPTSILGAAREAVSALRGVIPEAEGRLGVAGQVVQGLSGINLRSELTPQLLNRGATDLGFEDSYGSQESFVRTLIRFGSGVSEELERRSTTAVQRKDPNARYYSALDDIEVRRIGRLEDELVNLGNRAFQVVGINKQAAGARAQARIDREFAENDVNDPDPNKRALAQHFAAIDAARNEAGNFPEDAVQKELAKVEPLWTPEQKNFVLRNTNMRPIPVRNGVAANVGKTLLKAYDASHAARVAHLEAIGHPELIPTLRAYITAQPIPEPQQ
jgi:hypothetical protein